MNRHGHVPIVPYLGMLKFEFLIIFTCHEISSSDFVQPFKKKVILSSWPYKNRVGLTGFHQQADLQILGIYDSVGQCPSFEPNAAVHPGTPESPRVLGPARCRRVCVRGPGPFRDWGREREADASQRHADK